MTDTRGTDSCPRCGELTDLEASFCSKCGAVIGSGSKILTRVGRTAISAAEGSGVVARELDRSPTPGTAGEFAPGTMLGGRYRIVALLGRGGMGVVYRADDLRLGQPVALKFLRPALARDARRLEAFHAEVRHSRQVSHPNVCGVYDIGECDGLHFLTMEYVDGEDLASLLRRIGRLPPAKALEIAHQVCAGLAAAHEQGLVHRDLKPANIMIDRHGRAKITDFGLAMVEDEGSQSGEMAGTPQYMAPEQLAFGGGSFKSDLYALGLVMYEIYTGSRAFAAGSLIELRRLQELGPPPRLSESVSGIEIPVENMVLRCLQPDPAKRPDSARHVAAALPGGDPLAAAIAAGQTPSPEMVAVAGAEGVLRRSSAWALLVSCLLLIILCGVLASSQTVLGVARPAKSPEVLAERARGIIAELGFEESPTDSHFWLSVDIDELIAKNDPRETEASLQSGTLARFTFRQSPKPLRPLNPVHSVSASRPALDVPGMVSVELDSAGRLLKLLAVGLRQQGRSAEAPEPDWEILFSAAGLAISDFESIQVGHYPRSAYDLRRAWRDLRQPVEIHAASLLGQVVLFESVSSKREARGAAAKRQSTQSAVLGFFWVGGIFSMIVVGVYFARRNLRLGRCDPSGALRLSVFFGLVHLASNVLLAHHAYSSPMKFYSWLRANVASAIFAALLVGLLYTALEPYARRHWSRLLVGSSRVLTGRLKDPLVGTHLLIGAALGSAFAALRLTFGQISTWFSGSPSTIVSTDFEALQGAGQYLGAVLGNAQWTLVGIIIITAAMALLRALTGRPWAGIAGAAFWLLMVYLRAMPPWVPPSEMYFLALTMTVYYVVVLVRFGVLTTFTMSFTAYILLYLPLHLDTSAWYSGASMTTAILVVGIAVYGFVISLGGRPAFADLGFVD